MRRDDTRAACRAFFGWPKASGKVAAAMAAREGTAAERVVDFSLVSECAKWCWQAIGRLDQRPHSSDRDRQIAPNHKIDLDAFRQARPGSARADRPESLRGEHYMEHFHHAGGVTEN